MLALRNRPFATITSLRDEMDRLFGGVLNASPALTLPDFDTETVASPALNLWEDDNAIHVEAEMPGFKRDDLDISIDGDRLTIKGERSGEKEEEGKQYHRRERWLGRFARTITLPVPIDATKVSASLTGGVLTLTLPRREDAKPRKITVKPS